MRIEFDGDGFAPIVILHGDDVGLRQFVRLALQPDTVVEFQRQRGHEDGMVRVSELQNGRFTKRGSRGTRYAYLDGNAYGHGPRKKSRQLFRTSEFLINHRFAGFVHVASSPATFAGRAVRDETHVPPKEDRFPSGENALQTPKVSASILC